jgi:uncharacterized membrane protein YeiB
MEIVYVLVSAVCGVICWITAKSKGRTGWWFLAGLIFNILGILLIAAASDRKEQAKATKKIGELNQAFEEQRFDNGTVFGDENDESICHACGNMKGPHGICREFNRVISATIIECVKFVDRKGAHDYKS